MYVGDITNKITDLNSKYWISNHEEKK